MKHRMHFSIFVILAIGLRTYSQAQIIITIAGNGTAGFVGDGGAATLAEFNQPMAIALDSSGNIYVADGFNDRIRKVNTGGIILTHAGNGGTGYGGDGGAATAAQTGFPDGVAADLFGNVYFSCENRVRKVNASEIISAFAGTGAVGFYGDGGLATLAEFNSILGVATDRQGNVYIVDAGNNRIRKVDAFGIIRTIAGNGILGYSGDGLAATAASINAPIEVIVDSIGNVYISDNGNFCIRKVNTSGIISTIAGNGYGGFSGDGGPATAAQFGYPWGVAVDKYGNVFIADHSNARIREVDTFGVIRTIAGGGTSGLGDGGPATAAELGCPTGVAVNSIGTVYIEDGCDNRIRVLTSGATLGDLPSHSVQKEISFYPNPVNDELYVSGITETTYYRILNVSGVCLGQGKLYHGGNAIPVKKYAPGIYILEMKGESGEPNMVRVVKE